MITPFNLEEAYPALIEEKGNMYAFRAAKMLNVSELDVLSVDSTVEYTVLVDDISAILSKIHTLGRVMALSRNEFAVHERKGQYGKLMGKGSPLLFVGKDIDLRIFPNDWKTTLAVTQKSDRGTRQSIQFFNSKGLAVHKIFMINESNLEAYSTLVKGLSSSNQSFNRIGELQESSKKSLYNLSEEEKTSFQEGWKALKDTHSFYGLYLKFKLQREQALDYAPEGYVCKITKPNLEELIKTISKDQLDIMCFVGNGGMIQIHTGKAENIMYKDQWINVLDPDFNLHLDLSGVANVWLVKKPSTDGAIHSVEVYDNKGEMIVQFFGKRKPGIPELQSWRNLIDLFWL